MLNIHTKKITNFFLISLILLGTFIMIFHTAPKAVFADNQIIYKDGMYCYHITDEQNREVCLIGVELKEAVNNLMIPGTALINDTRYTVSSVNISYQYYENELYKKFYQNVTKLTVGDNFTGRIMNLIYPFSNVRTVEFLSKNPPQEAGFALTSGCMDPDLKFIVPDGSEVAYKGVIKEVMQYSSLSDLYEHEIKMVPVITSDPSADIEDGCFNYGNFIFQVTASAKDKTGTVQLIGLNKSNFGTYLSLPEQVTNDDYTYNVTRLCTFSLVYCGARTIIIPDTVMEMEPAVFDKNVELLFLSKNCKVLPKAVITDENGESSLRFVSVPEGVTTISDNTFNVYGKNKASIILPSTLKAVGKKSLCLFDYITFQNQKPVNNIKAAIKSNTTVKVNSSAVKLFQSKVSSKISIVKAKNVVKSLKLTTTHNSLMLGINKAVNEKASLSKESNETVFWYSTDNSIVKVSDSGTITAKGAGTAYIIAYTRTSGLYKAIQVTVN